jgi:hypothetical protein
VEPLTLSIGVLFAVAGLAARVERRFNIIEEKLRQFEARLKGAGDEDE